MIAVGLLSLAFGFSAYYLVPYALVAFNFSLFSSVILTCTTGMMYSLSVLSNTMSPYVNVVVAKFVTAFEAQSTKSLTVKNLIAHKDRNQMASLVLSLIFCFIFFVNAAGIIPHMALQIESERNFGTHSLIFGHNNIPVTEIEQFIKSHSYAFTDWAAVTNQVYNKYDL